MHLSLRAKIFVAFVLMAGAMGAVTLLSVREMNRQLATAGLAAEQAAAAAGAIADLAALPDETEALLQAHLHAATPLAKQRIAGQLVAAATREALALARLKDLASGPEGAMIAGLQDSAGQAAALRARILAISTRDAAGEALGLVTREMPDLRAALLAGLADVAAQTGQTVLAARAGAALNAMAAAQKNALLDRDPAFVQRALDEIATARQELAAAMAGLPAAPALGPVQELLAALGRMDARLDGLLRDGGGEAADRIFSLQLQPLDRKITDSVEGLGALFQTGLRSAAQRATDQAATVQATLVLLADLALGLGFALVVFGLGRIGRGLEAAVRLAERMAETEAAPPAWVHGNLSGRLTAALVQISAGQGAVVASLEAVAAGRAPRGDLPDRLRAKFHALQALISTDTVALGANLRLAREATADLQSALQAAASGGAVLQASAEDLLATLAQPRDWRAPFDDAPREAALRHAVEADRHLAQLIAAEAEGGRLAQRLGLPPAGQAAPLRRIA